MDRAAVGEVAEGLRGAAIFLVAFAVTAVVSTVMTTIAVAVPINLLFGEGSFAQNASRGAYLLVFPISGYVAYRFLKRQSKKSSESYREHLTGPGNEMEVPDGWRETADDGNAIARIRFTGPEHERRFTARVALGWAIVASAPIASLLCGLSVMTLVLMGMMAAMPSAAGPSWQAYAYFGLFLFGGGSRVGWAAWLRRRELAHGPPALHLSQNGIRVAAAGESVLVPWSEITWVGVRTGLPPRRNGRALVARLVGTQRSFRAGSRTVLYQWYDPFPRWYQSLGLVRLFDLELLEDPSEASEAVRRFAKERWRG